MSLVIDLTPSEEARISASAEQAGMAPSEWVKRIVEANLPASVTGALDSAARAKPQQESRRRIPNSATEALFAKWAEEDARLTDAERKENERIYAEIEANGIPRVRI